MYKPIVFTLLSAFNRLYPLLTSLFFFPIMCSNQVTWVSQVHKHFTSNAEDTHSVTESFSSPPFHSVQLSISKPIKPSVSLSLAYAVAFSLILLEFSLSLFFLCQQIFICETNSQLADPGPQWAVEQILIYAEWLHDNVKVAETIQKKLL